MTGYYDYVLGLIPVSLIGITAMLSVIGLPLTLAVPVGAAVAIAIIGHAVFVNVPVSNPQPMTDTATTMPQSAAPTQGLNAE
ncbi:hypothetical protein [Natronocalculus amylovorans]|uniref:Uncharacterized protein n=1 Tax=Natronocalculus amylovorans TaxID=2917812 RepID=A0AAE3FVV9_9EURY|nr:hypothetical protein [Natronocalculus amylovorans]MCL9816293.1 hypothetical protein [Natronocalculus amylovorans]NUE03383.1 hypothetical protein [Halorubraceae archaeon YAN]